VFEYSIFWELAVSVSSYLAWNTLEPRSSAGICVSLKFAGGHCCHEIRWYPNSTEINWSARDVVILWVGTLGLWLLVSHMDN